MVVYDSNERRARAPLVQAGTVDNMYLNLNTLYTRLPRLTNLDQINNYLDQIIDNKILMNYSNYDLIYIYINYRDNQEILNKINIIFSKIANNYEYKTKLISQWQNKE